MWPTPEESQAFSQWTYTYAKAAQKELVQFLLRSESDPMTQLSAAPAPAAPSRRLVADRSSVTELSRARANDPPADREHDRAHDKGKANLQAKEEDKGKDNHRDNHKAKDNHKDKDKDRHKADDEEKAEDDKLKDRRRARPPDHDGNAAVQSSPPQFPPAQLAMGARARQPCQCCIA